MEGDSPVRGPESLSAILRAVFGESGCLGLQPKAGGKLHLRLNTSERPIANKYREGKLKSTLKRELKVREIANREAMGASTHRLASQTSYSGAGHGLRRRENPAV